MTPRPVPMSRRRDTPECGCNRRDVILSGM
jgi:hypothetical protein